MTKKKAGRGGEKGGTSAPARKRRVNPLPRELGPLIEAMADGVIVSNRRGQSVMMNRAVEQIIAADHFPDYFAKPLKERRGMLAPRGLDGAPLPPEQWPTNHALAGRPIPPQDVLVRGLDGIDRILNISATPIYDASHAIIGVITVYRDVTAQRRLEEMKDDFLSIASHELRAPLTPILVAAQMAERRLGQPDRAAEALPLVRDVIRYAHRLNVLMGALLDLSRIQGDRFAIQGEPCDAAAIIRDATESQVTQWGRPVALQCAAEHLDGEWDATRLWQVVANLVGNALKYSPADASVTVAAEFSDAAHLQIRVTDGGRGIPPEQLPYLFERFYRGKRAAEEEHRDGLGLGLYITRAIVAAHGGTIVANSVLGVGTTFTVTLPLHPPPGNAA